VSVGEKGGAVERRGQERGGAHLLAGYDIGSVAAAEAVLVASGSEVRGGGGGGRESECWEREKCKQGKRRY